MIVPMICHLKIRVEEDSGRQQSFTQANMKKIFLLGKSTNIQNVDLL